MDLSICVVNWNVKDDLARCLDSLREASPGLQVEVILVDNASSDGSVAMVRERFPEVQLIANEANLANPSAVTPAGGSA